MSPQTMLNTMKLALGMLFPGAGNEILKLVERLIFEAESTGQSGPEKLRYVLNLLLSWAESKGFMGNLPQAVREAIFRLMVEAVLWLLEKAGRINQQRATPSGAGLER